MATKSNNRRSAIDPAVSDLLHDLESRKAQRSLPVKERKRQKKEREKQASRNRVMYDLPPELTERVRQIAEREGVPASQLVAWLLTHTVSIDQLVDTHGVLHGYKKPSKSPRYEFNLEFSKNDETPS
jgi:hypothetical protein